MGISRPGRGVAPISRLKAGPRASGVRGAPPPPRAREAGPRGVAPAAAAMEAGEAEKMSSSPSAAAARTSCGRGGWRVRGRAFGPVNRSTSRPPLSPRPAIVFFPEPAKRKKDTTRESESTRATGRVRKGRRPAQRNQGKKKR